MRVWENPWIRISAGGWVALGAFALSLCLGSTALGALSEEPECEPNPTIAGPIYTLAKKFEKKDEYTFDEISQFWRRTSRDGVKFVRLPTANLAGTVGACHSKHFNPDFLSMTPEQWEAYKKGKGPGSGIQNRQEVGSYMAPIAACRWMDVMQEWTKECEVSNPDKNICALRWGDSSHRDTKEFKPHSVSGHGFGNCIDIRPIMKGTLEEFKAEHEKDPELPLFLKRTDDYKDWITSSTDTYYDREKTRRLLEILKEKGATQILFQDKVMEAEKGWRKNQLYRPYKGHANHIHVCFKETKENEKACEDFRYKPADCGPPLY